MATGGDPSQPTNPNDSKFEVPSLRRIGEFIRNVLELERLVRRLNDRNSKLEEELRLLQRQVDEHGGQLKAISSFISNAADKAETRAEETALRTVERYLQAMELAQLRSLPDDSKK